VTESEPRADEVTITPYRDGPLLVRGPVSLRDPDGSEIPIERRTIALCRCGRSRLKPFCDGSHKLASFRAPAGTQRGSAGVARRGDGGEAGSALTR
jgi:CDGSH-type Zn-finger protein